jgi:hypothetical protein
MGALAVQADCRCVGGRDRAEKRANLREVGAPAPQAGSFLGRIGQQLGHLVRVNLSVTQPMCGLLALAAHEV